MNKYRNSLPRLDALIVLEAVIRCEGITRAARELHVSQAAVSKRIQDLESYFGASLLERVGRRVIPTNTGRSLANQVATALDYLVDSCSEASGIVATDIITVAADSAVSHYWLGPALRKFGTHHPELSIRVITSDVNSDLTSDKNDIVVLYGAGVFPGWKLSPLFGQTIRPVASPSYFEQTLLNQTGNSLISEKATLLDHSRKGPDWTDWKIWANETGLQDLSFETKHRFDSYALAIDAAIDGQGIALASLPLLQNLIDSKKLVTVTDLQMKTRHDYFLAHPIGRPISNSAKTLFDWLSNQN